MNNLKITFVTQFFPAPDRVGQTGGTISNLNLLRSLARQHAVSVLSFDPTSKPSLFSAEKFHVFHHTAPAWSAAGMLRHWLPFVRNEVRAHIEKEGSPDIMMATTSGLASFDVTPNTTRRVTIVQAFENFGFQCQWVPLKSRINLGKQAVLRRFRDWSLIRQSDAILTNSKFMKNAISQRFNIEDDLIHVLQQQVDVATSPAPAPSKTIGFVHRGPDKNIALVSELARLAPDLNFLIYGHDSGLPADLPHNIAFMGWSSDRNAMFASAALWLVPSLWAEPFGRVSIEAQAAGRAVLVADHGGLPETVTDARFRLNGFDPGTWLARIRTLLDIPNEYLIRNSGQVRERFSAQSHDDIIDRAIKCITHSAERS